MNSVDRDSRENSLRNVITDVLLDPDFNPLSISVARIRVPAGLDESTWVDTGLCEVHILGKVPRDIDPVPPPFDVTGQDEEVVDPDDLPADIVEEIGATETSP